MRRETFIATKPGDVPQKWRYVDATNQPLGRLAVEVANVLMGKHRPEYTPHVDTGEYVIVTNATKVGLTGRKGEQRFKQRYSEYPGGLKMESYDSVRERKPEALIADAVRRMMPKNRLSRVMLKKLKVFPGAEHPYADHKPTPLTV
jgi:large subunit ribosomal protein L13